MSLFGKLDALSIQTNPFFIEKGEYKAEVTKAFYKTNRDDQKQLHIEFTITDEDSAFVTYKAVKFFTLVDPEMTAEKLALLPAEEQKSIKRNLGSIKKMLCGTDGKVSQRGLGVDPNDLNDEWDPSVLVGTKCDIAIDNYGDGNNGVAVQWANIIE